MSAEKEALKKELKRCLKQWEKSGSNGHFFDRHCVFREGVVSGLILSLRKIAPESSDAIDDLDNCLTTLTPNLLDSNEVMRKVDRI